MNIILVDTLEYQKLEFRVYHISHHQILFLSSMLCNQRKKKSIVWRRGSHSVFSRGTNNKQFYQLLHSEATFKKKYLSPSQINFDLIATLYFIRGGCYYKNLWRTQVKLRLTVVRVICMLFTSWEVHIKLCLISWILPEAVGGTHDRGHSFSKYGPT